MSACRGICAFRRQPAALAFRGCLGSGREATDRRGGSEREFYAHRAPPEWLEVLQPLGTNASKPFPETAPWLIAVFLSRFERLPDATTRKHYYMDESVSLATRRSRKAIPSAGRRLPGGRPKGDASLFC